MLVYQMKDCVQPVSVSREAKVLEGVAEAMRWLAPVLQAG
ncbi:hypothetical protein AVDCRST_MAG94-872 [uncultured Leptolyngbya sp.]|uniref:Uncharacterized protein n=1 Tax=uncultured Leptolyngbya sp. TaxID=332963 RepID=A0A6J4KN70_9CYAN|nr:hypothetical protein AVDCRST_MAG94-872 [uncultured Leptolyngbya sp.]